MYEGWKVRKRTSMKRNIIIAVAVIAGILAAVAIISILGTDTGTDLTIPHCPCENSSGCSLCRNTAFTGQRQNRKWDDNPAFLCYA